MVTVKRFFDRHTKLIESSKQFNSDPAFSDTILDRTFVSHMSHIKLDELFIESCRVQLDNIFAQIISDTEINHKKLAITAYAGTTHSLSLLVSACNYLASEISRYTEINLETYAINLSGYRKNNINPRKSDNCPIIPCEIQKFPIFDTPNLDFILFNDCFTEPKLIRDVHYYVSKNGVTDDKIKFAALFHIPALYDSIEIDSYTSENNIIVPKKFIKKPDYVGQIVTI